MKWLIIGVASVAMIAVGIGAGVVSDRLLDEEAPVAAIDEPHTDRPTSAFNVQAMDKSLPGIWLAMPIARDPNFVLLEHRANPWEGRLTYFVSHTGDDLAADLNKIEPAVVQTFNDATSDACKAVAFDIPEGEKVEIELRVEGQMITFDLPSHRCRIESWARKAPSRPVVGGTRADKDFNREVAAARLSAGFGGAGTLNDPKELVRIYEHEGLDGITSRLPIKFADGSVLEDMKVNRWTRNAELWVIASAEDSRELDAQIGRMGESEKRMMSVMISGMFQAAVCQGMKESGQKMPFRKLEVHMSSATGLKFMDLNLNTGAC